MILEAEINELLLREEMYRKQRSRAVWLRDGDHNITFFHSKANHRKRRNKIWDFLDSDGTWQTMEDGIASMAVKYFSNLSQSSVPQVLLAKFSADEVGMWLNLMSFQMFWNASRAKIPSVNHTHSAYS